MKVSVPFLRRGVYGSMFMLAWTYVCHSTNYYIDNVAGSDGNGGTSTNSAWETLSRASAQDYAPGDRILLKRGQTFAGSLQVKFDSGAAGNPILIGSYGSSPDRAVIDGTGETASIDVGYTEYIEVEDLEITGAGVLGATFGWTSPGKVWDHYHFRNLYIHDTSTAGINFYVSNLGGFTYKDISVTNCVFENIGGAGILVNKWAGEAVKTVKNIGPADPARTPGTYAIVIATNLTRVQIIPALFTVTVNGSGAASISVTDKGAGYKANDNLLIADADLGGGGASDLTFQVDKVQPADPNEFYHEDLVIRDNTITTTDGPGMQFGKIRNGVVERNVVTNPGGDPSVGGSGLWTWFCGTPSTTFIVQRNTFAGARGETDACGAHIDIGNVNNIFQYNTSIDNEGGFAEILGKSYNCVYRYNISINDGARVVFQNGARSEGRTLFFGGYTGQNGPQVGPFNNYVYNNTIYVKSDIVSKYSMKASASGGLFANNVIYVDGTATDIDAGVDASGIIFDNNLVYQNKVPTTPWNSYTNNWDADPQFVNAGGLDPADYVPGNTAEILDRGITLYMVPGDTNGVSGGFAVTEDFFGNPIVGQPDMGAIELLVPPTLTISEALGTITVEWDPAFGVLQSAPSVSGPWGAVATNSPYVIPASDPAAVYRVELP